MTSSKLASPIFMWQQDHTNIMCRGCKLGTFQCQGPLPSGNFTVCEVENHLVDQLNPLLMGHLAACELENYKFSIVKRVVK